VPDTVNLRISWAEALELEVATRTELLEKLDELREKHAEAVRKAMKKH